MRRKITLSQKVWEQADLVRRQEHISWDRLVFRAVDASREISLAKVLRNHWRSQKRSERFRKSLNGKFEVSLFFLRPEAKQLLLEAGRKQRRSPSEILENWIWETFGASGGATTERTEKDDAMTERAEKDSEKYDATTEGGVHSESAAQNSEERLQERRKAWEQEGEQWKWKPSMTLIWPEHAKARVLLEEEEVQGEKVRRVRSLFMYHLGSPECLDFLEPYRLDFFIEGKSKLVQTPVRMVSFRFERYADLNSKLAEKTSIFEQLEKGEIGNQIGII